MQTVSLECLIEMVQGPCGGNQELICSDASLITALDTIISSPFHGRVSKDLRLKVKANAVSLLASSLESRHNTTCHRAIAAEILPSSLEVLRKYLIAVHDGARIELTRHHTHLQQQQQQQQQDSAAGGGEDFVIGVSKAQEHVDIVMAALSDISSIYTKLSIFPGKFIEKSLHLSLS